MTKMKDRPGTDLWTLLQTRPEFAMFLLIDMFPLLALALPGSAGFFLPAASMFRVIRSMIRPRDQPLYCRRRERNDPVFTGGLHACDRDFGMYTHGC